MISVMIYDCCFARDSGSIFGFWIYFSFYGLWCMLILQLVCFTVPPFMWLCLYFETFPGLEAAIGCSHAKRFFFRHPSHPHQPGDGGWWIQSQ